MSPRISSILIPFSAAFDAHSVSISLDTSIPVICADGLCTDAHSATAPVPIPTSKIVFGVLDINDASHTASDVGLYRPRRILMRPSIKVKISCFSVIPIYNNSTKSKGKFMFNDAIIVQSAVSAFNNAALAAPMFFWIGLLMLPLFWLVYACGAYFIENQTVWPGLGNQKNALFNYSLIFYVMVFGWVIVMGGNYGVLRDGVSLLPYAIAVILFVLSALIVRGLRTINKPMPECVPERFRRHPRAMRLGFVALVAVFAGLFGAPNFFGFLLQASAVLCGALIGRAMRRDVGAILTTSLIILAVVTILLMQPEFFRFGQLGNLTLIHMVTLLICGALVAATLALRNIKPKGRIHQSAYIKLKWMTRFLAALCAALFLMTESVPVFLGTVVILFAMFAMSIWHAERVPAKLDKMVWAALLCAFGVVTIMPVITAVGIICWTTLAHGVCAKAGRFLL